MKKCACGADCAWCVDANKFRVAFPRAKVPPTHDADADTDHHCTACFMRLSDLRVTKCSKEGRVEVKRKGLPDKEPSR